MGIRTETNRHSLVCVLICVLAGSLAFARGQQAPPPVNPYGRFGINPDDPRPQAGFNFGRTQGGPPILTFGTVLRRANGSPVSGPQEITFSLFLAKDGGEPSWSETQIVTSDERGVVIAKVGSLHAEGFPMALLNSGEAGWFGWQVNGGPEEQPRHNLASLMTSYHQNFFSYQAELDRVAAKREAKGEDGSSVRGAYQRRLGFTDEQFAVVREITEKLAAKLKDLQAQACAITGLPLIDPDHPAPRPTPAEIAERKRRLAQRSPEDKAKLKELHSDREAAIGQAISDLRAALGPELAARWDDFVELDGGGLLPMPLFPESFLPVSSRVPLPGSEVRK